MTRSPKPQWSTVVKAIRAIDAPANEVAIPELVIHQVGDRNSPGWKDAIQVLLEMNVQKVITQFIDALLDQGKTISVWDSMAEDLCVVLTKMQGLYTLQCIPVLTYLLTQPFEEDFDKGFILDVFNTVEREKIVYTLPFVIEFALREGKTEAGQAAYDFVVSFPRHLVYPYASHIDGLVKIWKGNVFEHVCAK